MCAFPTQWILLSKNSTSTKNRVLLHVLSFSLTFSNLEYCHTLFPSQVPFPSIIYTYSLASGLCQYKHLKPLSQSSQNTEDKTHVEFNLGCNARRKMYPQ